MFVSNHQRLGLQAPGRPGEPLQSRADSAPRKSRQGGHGGEVRVSTGQKAAGKAAGQPDNQVKDKLGLTTISPAWSQHEGPPAAASERRPNVKAQAKKSKPAAKTAAKPVGKANPVVKAAAKAAKPSTSKVVAKKAAKPVAKAKAVAKPVAIPKAKAPVKSVPAKKAAVATKKTPAVTAKSRPPAKAVKAAPTKPVAKPAAKTAAKPAKPVASAKATAKPQEKTIIKTSNPTAPGPAPKAAPSPSPIAAAPSPLQTPPLKPGRRSSLRNSSFAPPPAPMVPTHSPDAAKASYSTITERVIAPPPHVAAKKDPKLANNWKSKPAEELTDEEVKAMPDSEYMNEKQLAFFRHKLSVLKQDIHNNAGETTEHLREDTVVVPDPADRATIEEEHALELRTRDRERKLLKKIEQSIARIDSGDYGYCDETGEAIGVGRLIARPTANLSLEAQQRRELKQKMFGD